MKLFDNFINNLFYAPPTYCEVSLDIFSLRERAGLPATLSLGRRARVRGNKRVISFAYPTSFRQGFDYLSFRINHAAKLGCWLTRSDIEPVGNKEAFGN